MANSSRIQQSDCIDCQFIRKNNSHDPVHNKTERTFNVIQYTKQRERTFNVIQYS